MLETNKIYNGDCLDVMKSIDDMSIDLIVTSPPYYVDKEYEKDILYEDYCLMMSYVFFEIGRVLKLGGYLVVNFGDYFNSTNRFYDADVPSCYPASINYFEWGNNVAKMDLQATRIWRKRFAKMSIPFVCNTHPRPVFDYEHIWTFRKKNGEKTEFVTDRKLSQRGVIGEDWSSPARIDKHCASFPVELPEWAIKVYSKNKDDIVLDPFAGFCTTGIACKNLNRQYILIEKNKDYYELAQFRLFDMFEE